MSETPSPQLSEIEALIDGFVRTYLVEEFTGVDPLAEREIDSLALEQLIDHLEEHYRILFIGEDLARANFASTPILSAVVIEVYQRTDEERKAFNRQRSEG